MQGITGIVLAGGLGRRMGRVEKGLLPFRGTPLVARVLERLAPQVESILLNANHNLAAYQAFGYPVVSDHIGGHVGPLAGLHCGMAAAKTPFVASVPCDAPLLPMDLIARLMASLQGASADVAVASTAGGLQPVFCLCRTSLRANLTDYLARGGRKVDAWLLGLQAVVVDFSDAEAAFANFNTPEALAQAAE